MANPFFEGPKTTVVSINQPSLNDIYKLLSQSKNPMQVFNELAKNNPNMAPINRMLQNGLSPQEVFYSLCEQRGIDPQGFLNNIR